MLGRNLLNDFAALRVHLLRELERGAWLNSYLLAAGMNQILEDHLHRDVLGLGKIAYHTGRLPGGGKFSNSLVRAVRRAALAVRSGTPSERRLNAWQVEMSGLVSDLAHQISSDHANWDGDNEGCDEIPPRASSLLHRLAGAPRDLQDAVARPPTCFRSLDERPADCERLAQLFAGRWPDRTVPILVIGLRTSGSYLAPLCVSSLTRLGFAAEAMTMRPTQDMHAADRARLASVVARGGRVLITDDPPSSGNALALTAEQLATLGVPSESIAMLVPLIGKLPKRLEAFQTLTLPWDDWSIQQSLSNASVTDQLSRLLIGKTLSVGTNLIEVALVRGARRVALEPMREAMSGSPSRRHVRALFVVRLVSTEGETFVRHVYVKGVGLGYYGDHSQIVAAAIDGYGPELYGVRDGLMYRAWIPDARKVTPETISGDQHFATRTAEYAAIRARHLRVDADVSQRLDHLHPGWRRIANILMRGWGRGRFLVRPLLHALAIRFLKAEVPVVIDGSMSLDNWFYGDPPRPAESMVKVDYDERAFATQDTVTDELYTYDIAFDLASLVADLEIQGSPAHGFGQRLRETFDAITDTRITAERWWLNRLLYADSYQQVLRGKMLDSAGIEAPEIIGRMVAAERAMASCTREYLAQAMLGDLTRPASGALCAIDIDGVLETSGFGFPAPTPLGLVALRALILHGYRPVLVSGRSLDEVQARCRDYRLPGAVAEYGAVLFKNDSDEAVDLLDRGQLTRLDRLRRTLSRLPGVYVDPTYRRAVRACQVCSDGSWRALDSEIVGAALRETDNESFIRPIPGRAQTDFMVSGIDKGLGLRSLVEALALSSTDSETVAFAVGDSESDPPMFACARLACATAAGAFGSLDSRVVRLKSSFQAGLSEGVSMLLGHTPGSCAVCRRPPMTREAEAAFVVMAVQPGGRWAKLAALIELLVHTRSLRV